MKAVIAVKFDGDDLDDVLAEAERRGVKVTEFVRAAVLEAMNTHITLVNPHSSTQGADLVNFSIRQVT